MTSRVALAAWMLVLFLVALAAATVAAGSRAPAALPPQVGGFVEAAAVIDAGAGPLHRRPAVAITDRRHISIPYTLAAPDRRVISPTIGAAVVARRNISVPLASAVTAPAASPVSTGDEAAAVQILVMEPGGQSWRPLGEPLAADPADGSHSPALAFDDLEFARPWVAFVEPRRRLGNTRHVFVGVHTGEAWQIAPEPLNADPAQHADNPSLAVNAAAGAYVAWEEQRPSSGLVVARRYISDSRASRAVVTTEAAAALNFDATRHARAPDVVLSGPGNTVPWVTWYEEGGGRPSRVFAARRVEDAAAPNGFRWEIVGRRPNCGGDETGCSLGVGGEPGRTPRIAGGFLPGETTPTPWVTFIEGPLDGGRVHVMRLRIGDPNDPSDDHFAPVGQSVSVSCLGRRGLRAEASADADIDVVGNVPHVAWTEQQGDAGRVFVCHLLDARAGREIWDLDTGASGAAADSTRTAQAPALVSASGTPFVGWFEAPGVDGQGGVTRAAEGATEVSLQLSLRSPAGPAWGTVYPPHVRCPGGKAGDAGGVCAPKGLDRGQVSGSPSPVFVGDGVEIMTTCDHVNGWRHIARTEFALYDATTEERVFWGKYVPGETPTTGTVYVEDPNAPGMCRPGEPGSICLGGVPIGTNVTVETSHVTLSIGEMSVEAHGPVSPALDVYWVLRFKRSGVYVQAINIVYRDLGSGAALTETDLFQVGPLSVRALVGRLFLPVVQMGRSR